MRLSSGVPVIRKDDSGNTVNWTCQTAALRCIMAPSSYMEREKIAVARYLKTIQKEK